MVRQALNLYSKPQIADKLIKPAIIPILQQPLHLAGAKSILSCSLQRALLLNRRRTVRSINERYMKKNGVTHASAPHRFIANLNS